jgi:hypothetical protein
MPVSDYEVIAQVPDNHEKLQTCGGTAALRHLTDICRESVHCQRFHVFIIHSLLLIAVLAGGYMDTLLLGRLKTNAFILREFPECI